MEAFQHGKSKTYEVGCRCPVCVESQRARVARNRADRLASGRLNHGTRSAYDAGCRCGPCRDVRRAAYKRETLKAAQR